MKKFSRHLTAYLLTLFFAWTACAFSAQADDWRSIISRAKGQTIYWNAWGGSQQYNDFINWVRVRVAKEYGVRLQHVKIKDTANAVRTVLSEVQAGKTNGSVDLIWINGANFNAMKQANLLYGPMTKKLPNFKLVDTKTNSATVMDFGVPTDGYESPWGMARFNFGYDSARLAQPPQSARALLDYARSNPLRITYPAIPDFTGLAFLKQILLELTNQDKRLFTPLLSKQKFNDVTAPLWLYLDELHEYAWRKGKDFPANETALFDLLNNQAVDLTMSYNLGAVSSAIARGDLPETARSMVFEGGTLGNVNFVAIPVNSSSPEAAMVVANFLLSPEAQSRRQHPDIWGDQTVLDMKRLAPKVRNLFAILPKTASSVQNLGRTLAEPHPTWTNFLQDEWIKRYAQ